MVSRRDRVPRTALARATRASSTATLVFRTPQSISDAPVTRYRYSGLSDTFRTVLIESFDVMLRVSPGESRARVRPHFETPERQPRPSGRGSCKNGPGA